MRRFASIAVAGFALLETVLLIHLALVGTPLGIDRFWGLSFVGFLVVGAYSILRRLRHRVGWVLVGIGIAISTALLGEQSVISYVPERAIPYTALLGLPLLVGGFALIAFFLLWYPTGDIPSPRWRWVETSMTVLVIVMMVYYALRPGPASELGPENPIGLQVLVPLRDSPPEVAAGFLLVLFGLANLGSLVARYRKGSWTVRRQIRLVLYPALAFVLGYLIFLVSPVPDLASSILPFSFIAVFVLGFNGIAIGVGVAIARYRLYDIDRIVSRTVSYALVVGILAGVFATGVVWIPSVLDLGDSQLLVAASTLVVAALFNPLRRGAQRVVDRRFNRSRYDAERVMDAFAGSLQDEVDPDDVVLRWIGVVSETMQPSTVSVWVKAGR